MKIMSLLLMMLFIVIPCSANSDIYNVQFADSNGVFTGNTDFVKCEININDNDKSIMSTVIVDISNRMSKIIDVNGKSNEKKENWAEMRRDLFNDVIQYVNANHASVLKASFNNPQSAYRVN